MDITLISTNSSYGALSSYTFIFNNLGDVPVRFVKVTLPDCFSANLTALLAKTAKVSGAMEFTEVYAINNSTRDFWFNCNCTNFTLSSILNAGPAGGQCVSTTKVFGLYNYDDAGLSKMIFKNEQGLEPALGCANECQSCLPANKSFCTSCVQPLL